MHGGIDGAICVEGDDRKLGAAVLDVLVQVHAVLAGIFLSVFSLHQVGRLIYRQYAPF